ncbi:hypothetical protein [Acinetobacter seifertii]|uniref:hypothetical protein n=1 Tax=Acinetobacter seifertii TaxID=1530123 RepID=UPI00124FBB73|nr:hypothetical protein [Acinetobacter seifertii]
MMDIKISPKNISNIEIQLDDVTYFSNTVPINGSHMGLMTNDVEINKKLKQILENALASIEISLQSNS